MGGQAIQNSQRLPAADYRVLEADLLLKISEIYPQSWPVAYYRSKADFGDMDIIVAKPKLSKSEFEAFLKEIKSQEVVYNRDNISFEYQQFQIDLIFVEPEQVTSALFYYSFNDLNNLVGRIAHKLGLKFGWDGLYYQIRTESGHRAQNILLSRDPAQIYAFLGYDYARWQAGFENLNEIFEFVVSSPYFHAEIYSEENINHINRTRNRKRKTYAAFLDYLAQETDLTHYSFESDKSIYLIRIHNAFLDVDFLGQLKGYAAQIRLFEQRQNKFNGHLVHGWTGLQGAELGKCIQRFKQSVPDFDAWLDSQNQSELQRYFIAWFQS